MALFEKGKVANPAGRPRGKSKHQKLADKLARAIELDAVDVIRAVVRAAKGGDMTAAKILLDRLVPPVKARESGGDRGRPLININLTGIEAPKKALKGEVVKEVVKVSTPNLETIEDAEVVEDGGDSTESVPS